MVPKLVELLRRTGLRKGLRGDSRAWFAVWLGITAARQVSKRIGKEPDLVDRVVLKPGQQLVITDTGVPWAEDAVRRQSSQHSRRRGRF